MLYAIFSGHRFFRGYSPFVRRAAAQRTDALKRKLEELDATHPGAPPRAMVLGQSRHRPIPTSSLAASGNQARKPRQFLAVLSSEKQKTV